MEIRQLPNLLMFLPTKILHHTVCTYIYSNILMHVQWNLDYPNLNYPNPRLSEQSSCLFY